MPRYFSAISSSLLSCSPLAVAPVLPRLRVQILGERFGEPIGDRLHHDRVVVVEIALEAAHQLVGAEPGGDGEQPEVVGHAAFPRGDEISQRTVRASGRR